MDVMLNWINDDGFIHIENISNIFKMFETFKRTINITITEDNYIKISSFIRFIY